MPASWVKSLAPSLTVPASGSASTVLQLQTPIAAGSGRFPFRVVASTATGSDTAYGAFNNYYAADIGSETSAVVSSSTVSATPNPATAARGGTTAIRVHVSNTGTAVDRYWLTPNSYPGNWTMTLDPPEVYVQPGQSTDFFVTSHCRPTPAPARRTSRSIWWPISLCAAC
jgi:hypothetical protein